MLYQFVSPKNHQRLCRRGEEEEAFRESASWCRQCTEDIKTSGQPLPDSPTLELDLNAIALGSQNPAMRYRVEWRMLTDRRRWQILCFEITILLPDAHQECLLLISGRHFVSIILALHAAKYRGFVSSMVIKGLVENVYFKQGPLNRPSPW